MGIAHALPSDDLQALRLMAARRLLSRSNAARSGVDEVSAHVRPTQASRWLRAGRLLCEGKRSDLVMVYSRTRDGGWAASRRATLAFLWECERFVERDPCKPTQISVRIVTGDALEQVTFGEFLGCVECYEADAVRTVAEKPREFGK